MIPGFQTIFPRGEGAATGPMPHGYVMVSRWIGAAEVKLWMATGGTYIPPEVGRGSGYVSVILFGAPMPAGLGRDNVIRIDFGVPQAALNLAGVGSRILQPATNMPIYNVSMHIPNTLKIDEVLRNRGM